MRALVKPGEVYPEHAWIDYTRENLDWYRTARPDGMGYALVEDWDEDAVYVFSEETVVLEEEDGFRMTRTYVTARKVGEDEPADEPEGQPEDAPVVAPEEPEEAPETVTVGGKTYTLEELKQLINNQ